MSDKNELAQDRTDWAEDRTRLAAERTYAGWIRTGLTTVVVALALQAVFSVYEPKWVPKTIASAFLFAALVIFVAGWDEARRACRDLDTHNATAQPTWRLSVLSLLLAFGVIGIGVVLWQL